MQYRKADRIANVVNAMVPEHVVGAAAPEVIENKRVANCFARMALVGVGLMMMGLDECDMTMLVGMNHGLLKEAAHGVSSNTPYWYGHTMLVVHDKRPTVVFDASNNVFAYNARVAGWESNYRTEPPLFLVDKGRLGAPQSEYADLRMPDDVWRLGAHSTLHSFADGIAYYQQAHPVLAEESPWEVAHFRMAFAALADFAPDL